MSSSVALGKTRPPLYILSERSLGNIFGIQKREDYFQTAKESRNVRWQYLKNSD